MLPLPSHQPGHRTQHDIDSEMHAAFDYSEDEDDDDSADLESRPLNPVHTSPHHPSTAVPGTYDFENVDYDYPPPGSPPRPTAVALPNEHGNTNGLIPTFDDSSRPFPRQNWLQRTASRALPSSLAERLGLQPSRPSGAVGGGTLNDGVFANVTAKPSAPVRIQEGTKLRLRMHAAQADAVPPYWDTTVHAPFAPDSFGEMIIDALPTGSLFSFLWNMLVSISFQFVGFLLTYLLHTTHAARLGSRAGLGVTLIQYGFALRSRMDGADGEPASWGSWKRPPPGSADSDPYDTSYNATLPGLGNIGTGSSTTTDQTNSILADATTEWLSFFLMTIGWFILLTSILGFWRVKQDVASRMHDAFSLRGVAWPGFIRRGFGMGGSADRSNEPARTPSRAEEGLASHD
ncbi:hypothetical protein F5887DRAFT_937018 [Amanita rubescens]|nr:hypothetical protein F5887DRAFT_937018 [Amanita rubescens]